VPYIVVIGDREIKEGKLAVRKRGLKEQQMMDFKSLVKEIKGQIKAYPFEPLSLPISLSKRPVM
jgi:threonyl-tRNA synthetase